MNVFYFPNSLLSNFLLQMMKRNEFLIKRQLKRCKVPSKVITLKRYTLLFYDNHFFMSFILNRKPNWNCFVNNWTIEKRNKSKMTKSFMIVCGCFFRFVCVFVCCCELSISYPNDSNELNKCYIHILHNDKYITCS